MKLFSALCLCLFLSLAVIAQSNPKHQICVNARDASGNLQLDRKKGFFTLKIHFPEAITLEGRGEIVTVDEVVYLRYADPDYVLLASVDQEHHLGTVTLYVRPKISNWNDGAFMFVDPQAGLIPCHE